MRTNTQPDWQRDVEREIGQAAKILGLGDWVVRQFSTAAAFILLGAGVAGGVIGVIVGRLAEQNLSGQALSHSNMVGSIVGILVGSFLGVRLAAIVLNWWHLYVSRHSGATRHRVSGAMVHARGQSVGIGEYVLVRFVFIGIVGLIVGAAPLQIGARWGIALSLILARFIYVAYRSLESDE